ncbi:MAG TPA: hypothetical protein PLK94_03420 [Alphaproteobacteria bacterium]|nr:hypothetical protein [Alphaproteobacteria bacterium]
MNPNQPASELSTKISSLNSEYAMWFSQILRSAFYKENAKAVDFPSDIGSVKEIKDKINNESMLERLKANQTNLHQLATKLISVDGIPPLEDFDNFWQTYEGFSTQLKRLDRNAVLADFGFDMSTGLRSDAVMVPELEKELERRSRRGQPFSVAVLRIDDTNLRSDEKTIAAVTKAVMKTIRSFDDAYSPGNGEFVISLKHSDANGGLRFVTRFNQALKEGDYYDFTVSSCVAEPLPGDEIPVLLANVRADLDHICELGSGGAGQYEEVSPLNRFLQTLQLDETQPPDKS